MPTNCRLQCEDWIAEGQEPLHSAAYCHQNPRVLKENHRINQAGRDLWRSLVQPSAPKQGYFQNQIKLLRAFSHQLLKISRDCTTSLGNLTKGSDTLIVKKKNSFCLAGISLGAICDCCLPPFLCAPRRVKEGGYIENMDPFR